MQYCLLGFKSLTPGSLSDLHQALHLRQTHKHPEVEQSHFILYRLSVWEMDLHNHNGIVASVAVTDCHCHVSNMR